MTTDRQALLDALLVERYGRNQWWTTRATTEQTDDDLTCARRRRELVADFERLQQKGAS